MLDTNGQILYEPFSADDARQFTVANLQAPNFAADLLTFARVMNDEREYGDINDIRIHVQSLLAQTNLQETNPSLHKEIANVLSQMGLMTIVSFAKTPNELMNLFRSQLVACLALNVNIQEQVVLMLRLLPSSEIPVMRRRITQAIRENNERLGQSSLTIEGQSAEPTLKEWFNDFTAFTNKSPLTIESIDIASYFNDSANARRLTEAEKDVLRRALYLYLFIEMPVSADNRPRFVDHIPTLKNITLPNIVGDEPSSAKRKIPSTKLAVPSASQAVPVRPVPAASTPSAVAPANRPSLRPYVEATPFDTEVAAAEQTLLPLIGRGTFNVRQTFDEAVAAKNAAKVVALFHVLAETRDVHKLMAADKTFRTKLTNKFGPDVVAHYDANPDAPVYLRVYLEYVLQDTLKLPESDAARVAVRLANILGKRYLKIAFMDMASGIFAWAPVEKQGGQLVLRY